MNLNPHPPCTSTGLHREIFYFDQPDQVMRIFLDFHITTPQDLVNYMSSGNNEINEPDQHNINIWLGEASTRQWLHNEAAAQRDDWNEPASYAEIRGQ